MVASISTSQLRVRLFLYFGVGLLVFAVSLSVATMLPIYDRLRVAEDRNLYHDAETRAMAIGEWARRARDVARQVTSRSRIRQELIKYNNRTISIDNLRAFTEPKLADAMNLSGEILGIARLDVQGQAVSRCGLPIAENRWPEPHPDPKTVAVSAPYTMGDHRVVVIRAPILSRDGKTVGYDLVLNDLCELRAIIMNRSGVGQTSDIVLAAAVGAGIRSIFPRANREKPGETTDALDNTPAGFLEKGVNGKKGLAHVGNTVFAYAPIGGFSWALLVSQGKSELYATLHNKLAIIALFSLLLYLTFLGGFWFVTKPLAGRLLLHAEELETKIEEKTRHLNEEIQTRIAAEAQRNATIEDLQKALSQVKTLRGLIPICSICKKIRDDKGYWNKIEAYIHAHSEAEFSHGICPDCARTYYPDIDIPERNGEETP